MTLVGNIHRLVLERIKNLVYIQMHMKTIKIKLSDQKGSRRLIVKSNRSKKPLTQILEEERAAEKIREDARKKNV